MSWHRSDEEQFDDGEHPSDEARFDEARFDEARFEALFDANFDDVWRFARRRCASSNDADDIAAQVFAVAWRRRDDAPAETVRLWLFGVARNVLANHHRSDDRARRLRRRLAGERLAPVTGWLGDVATDDRDERLRRSIDELNDDDREVLIMRYWDELAVTEIAALLDRTPNAVSMRLHKTRRRLAEAIDGKELTDGRHVVVDSRYGSEDDDELA